MTLLETAKGADGKPLKTKSGESVKLDALLTEAVERAELDLAKAKDGIWIELRTALDQVKVAEEIVKALSGNVAQARRLHAAVGQ